MSTQLKETVVLQTSCGGGWRNEPLWTLRALDEEDEMGHVYWLVLQAGSPNDACPRFATSYHSMQDIVAAFWQLHKTVQSITDANKHLGIWEQDVSLPDKEDRHRAVPRYASASAKGVGDMETRKFFILELSEECAHGETWALRLSDVNSNKYWRTHYRSTYVAAISFENMFRTLQCILYNAHLADERDYLEAE